MTKARDLANIISGGFTADDIPNLDTSKITTGTFADARISSSSVTQHSTPFDDNKIVNDISTIALRQASDQNKVAYNTNSSFVDVFQDSSGITNLTNVSNVSEYIASVYSNTVIPTMSVLQGTVHNTNAVFSLNTSTGLITHDTTTTSEYSSDRDNSSYGIRLDFGQNMTFTSGVVLQVLSGYDVGGNDNIAVTEFNFSTSAGSNYIFGGGGTTPTVYLNANGGSWGDVGTNGTVSLYNQLLYQYKGMYVGSTTYVPAIIKYEFSPTTFNARYVDVMFNDTAGRIGTFKIFHNTTDTNVNQSSATNIVTSMVDSANNATGSFESNAITAPSSVSSMGAIITYQDNAGTNTLNTDIVLQLSADGGSNYSTATLTALPDFSTGIKMAKVNDLAVTSGTSLKYKLSFANQASGTKEARIRGVALQY